MFAMLCASALAAEREVDLELGWLGAEDPAYDLFSEADSLSTWGVRAGWPVMDRLAVVGGWQHGASGMTLQSGEDLEIATGLWSNAASLGVKADVSMTRWLSLYATVQGAGLFQLARMDDDPEDDENAGQVEAHGFAPGAYAALGPEFLIPLGKDKERSLALYAEFGYGWLAPMELGDFGRIQYMGFSGRLGTGVRF